MKTIIKNILIIGAFALLSSCLKDKGNYNYTEINEVTISGIESNYARQKGVGARFTISPTVTSTKGGDSNFSYKWQISGGKVLSTDKTIDIPADLDAGSYTVYFKVMDNNTGIEWKTNTVFTVNYPIARGYLLLGETSQGYAQLDMIAMPEEGDTTVMTDILAKSGMPKVKGAKSVLFTGSHYTESYVKLWVVGDDASYYANPITLESSSKNQFINLVYSSRQLPADFHAVTIGPVAANGTNSPAYRFMVCNNGMLFKSSLTSNGDFYGNPINYVSAEGSGSLSPLSPMVAYASGYYYGLLTFDTNKRRFLFVSNLNSVMTRFTDANGAATTPFPWNQEGTPRKLKFIDNTRNTTGGSSNGNSFAIMCDTVTNVHYVYQFYVYGSVPAKRAMYTINSTIAPNFASADLYAFASSRTLIFYSVGAKLYAYDYNTGNERNVEIDFGNSAGDAITLLKFNNQQTGMFNHLFIATYNATEGGTIQEFMLETDDLCKESHFRVRPLDVAARVIFNRHSTAFIEPNIYVLSNDILF